MVKDFQNCNRLKIKVVLIKINISSFNGFKHNVRIIDIYKIINVGLY